jgi:hypothetical protein
MTTSLNMLNGTGQLLTDLDLGSGRAREREQAEIAGAPPRSADGRACIADECAPRC